MNVSCPSCQRNYVVADEQIAGKQFRARCKSCGVEFRLDGTPAREKDTSASEAAKFMSATEAYLALQSAPPPSGASWSVCVSPTDTRRMTTDEVALALVRGKITTSVFVWKSGMPKWLRLSDVPELMTAADQTAGRSDASARASKPSPPNRVSATAGLSHPPVSVGSTIPARSGQTAPPPPMMVAAAVSPSNDVAAAVAPAQSQPPSASGTRRATPQPPRRALDIPIDVVLPETEAVPGHGSPPQAAPVAPDDSTADPPQPVATIAAASKTSADDVPGADQGKRVAVGADVVLPPIAQGARGEPRREIAAPAAVSELPAKREDSLRSEPSPKATSTGPALAMASSTLPELPGRRRFAGVVVAMGTVGLIGVLGGVAGAVYVMRASAAAPQRTSVPLAAVALPPQAATPVAGTAAPMAVTTASASASQAETSVIDGDSRASAGDSRASAADASQKPNVRATRAAGSYSTRGVKEAESRPASGPADPSATAESSPASGAKSSSTTTAGPAPFNRDAALAVLGLAATRASSCKKAGGPTGTAKVHVTFDPNGSVVIANVVGAPIAGTSVAQCVASAFRRVKIAPFSGERSSLAKDVTIPP